MTDIANDIRRVLIAAILVIGVCLPVAAADLGGDPGWQAPVSEPVPPSRGWTFNFTPYSWLAWTTGDLAVRGRQVDVKATPIDLIDALDWSTVPIWMSYAEARNGRFSLFNDIVYAKLAGSGDFATAAQGQFATLALGGRIKVDYEQATIELGAGYEVWSSASQSGRSAVDVLAGGRYWHQDTSISADLNATLSIAGPLGIVDLTKSANRVVAGSGTVDWFDPFVGLRLRQDLAPGQSLMVRGDVGGFGAGSDFSWQAIATYSWQMCIGQGYALDGYLGYRALSVDYSEGTGNKRYEYDILQHGPVVGATLRF